MATTNKAAAADKGKKAAYEVISPLDHDNERYAIGDEVELTDAQAEQLLGHTVKATAKAAKAD